MSNKRKKLENASIFETKLTVDTTKDWNKMSPVEYLVRGGEAPKESQAIALISIDEIEVLPQASGRPSEPTDIDELRESIKQNGLLQNIVVCKAQKGSRFKYRLIAGHRRRMACLALGKREIEAKILDIEPDDSNIEAIQLIENIQQKALTALEEAVGIRSYKNASDLPVRGVAKALGLGTATVQDSIRIADWHDEKFKDWVYARAYAENPDDPESSELYARAYESIKKCNRTTLRTLALMEKTEILGQLLPKINEISSRELISTIKREEAKLKHQNQPDKQVKDLVLLDLKEIQKVITKHLEKPVNKQHRMAIEDLLEQDQQAIDVAINEAVKCINQIGRRILWRMFPAKNIQFSPVKATLIDDEQASRLDKFSKKEKIDKSKISLDDLSSTHRSFLDHINEFFGCFEGRVSATVFDELLEQCSFEDMVKTFNEDIPFTKGNKPGGIFVKMCRGDYEGIRLKNPNKKFAQHHQPWVSPEEEERGEFLDKVFDLIWELGEEEKHHLSTGEAPFFLLERERYDFGTKSISLHPSAERNIKKEDVSKLRSFLKLVSKKSGEDISLSIGEGSG